MGRWLNSDDISYLDPLTLNGLNLYAYCFNNPVRFVDNCGKSPIDIIDKTFTLFEEVLLRILEKGSKALGKVFGEIASQLSDDLIISAGSTLSKWPNRLGQAYGAMANTTSTLSNVFSTLGKVAKGVGIALLVIDSGISVYNNFNNSELSLDRKMTDSVVDIGVNVGIYYAIGLGFKLGAFIGTLIPIPVIGTVVGAFIGTLIAAGIWAITEYTSIIDLIKDGVSWLVNLFI